MNPEYKKALEGLARLSDRANPGEWRWCGDEKAGATEEAFLAWARNTYRNSVTEDGVMHFIGAKGAESDDMTICAWVGFGHSGVANSSFIHACVAYVRGLIDLYREQGIIDGPGDPGVVHPTPEKEPVDPKSERADQGQSPLPLVGS